MIHVEGGGRKLCGWKIPEAEVKVTTMQCFPLSLLSCHVSPERKGDLEPSSAFSNWIVISFWISGWEGGARWRGWMKTESRRETSTTENERKTEAQLMWATERVQQQRPHTVIVLSPGWICWNARSGTHNRGGTGANNAGFSSENKSKRQTDSSRKLQHHLAAHSARFPLNETPYFLAALLKRRPFKTHCHLCFQSSCRMSEVAAVFEGHLIIRVKRLQGHKQSLFKFRHLVEAHSSYFCPVNWDFWTTSSSLPFTNMNSASGWIKAQTAIMLNMGLRNLPSPWECVALCPLLSTVLNLWIFKIYPTSFIKCSLHFIWSPRF